MHPAVSIATTATRISAVAVIPVRTAEKQVAGVTNVTTVVNV